MKRVVVMFLGLALLAACDKDHRDEKETKCPTITREEVHASALKHFGDNYAGATDVVWFNVDSKLLTASFDLNGSEYEVNYSNSGDYMSEEIEVGNEKEEKVGLFGSHKDDEEDDETCSCDRD